MYSRIFCYIDTKFIYNLISNNPSWQEKYINATMFEPYSFVNDQLHDVSPKKTRLLYNREFTMCWYALLIIIYLS